MVQVEDDKTKFQCARGGRPSDLSLLSLAGVLLLGRTLINVWAEPVRFLHCFHSIYRQLRAAISTVTQHLWYYLCEISSFIFESRF